MTSQTLPIHTSRGVRKAFADASACMKNRRCHSCRTYSGIGGRTDSLLKDEVSIRIASPDPSTKVPTATALEFEDLRLRRLIATPFSTRQGTCQAFPLTILVCIP